MRRVLFVFCISILGAGCASTAADFANTPTEVLCAKLATLPAYNVHRRAREQALKNRGADCSKMDQTNIVITK